MAISRKIKMFIAKNHIVTVGGCSTFNDHEEQFEVGIRSKHVAKEFVLVQGPWETEADAINAGEKIVQLLDKGKKPKEIEAVFEDMT